METFALYLVRSSAWITGFAIIYFLFLKNERFFVLNRFYLLFGIFASFILPIIRVHYPAEMHVVSNFVPEYINETGVMKVSQKSFDFRLIPAIIYLSGLFFFSLRVFSQTRILFKTVRKAGFNKTGNAKLVRVSDSPNSFSFFNYIFINQSVTGVERTEILNHELVHISQKHWLDLILAEILCLAMWANPIVWIYSRFIRLNHEYLADEVALKQTTDQAVYKAVLLNQIAGVPVFELSNSFNYSPGKKRFEMMKKVVRSPYRKLRVLYFLPVSVFLFYAFAVPEYTYPQIDGVFTIYQPSALESKDVKGIVVLEDGTPLNGVYIIVSGTSAGVTTDDLGRFTLANVQKNATIALSLAGYKTQMLKPQFSSEMRIVLQKDPDYKKREHVVTAVAPSGAIKLRSDSDGSGFNGLLVIDGLISTKEISEILPSEIESITVLKGKSATDLYGNKAKNGVMEISTINRRVPELPARTDTSDAPSSSVIRIRSSDGSSFNGLLVVDGVITEKDISDISPGEIESMNVLKDKSATDKYGEKGKNGVIEITTKRKPLK